MSSDPASRRRRAADAHGRIRSIGVLHPTFEVWGGAEWFIHQTLGVLAREEGIAATVYTHRWKVPPGETHPYRVVTHRLGGIVSGPWDWMRIARTLGRAWRSHDLLFIHNHPAALWYARAAEIAPLPPAVWYCHEPSAALYGPEFPGDAEPRSGPSLPRRLSSVGFYRSKSAWRLLSAARLRLSRARAGREGWSEQMRQLDRDAVAKVGAIVANSRFTASRVLALYARESRVVRPLPPDLGTFAPTDTVAKEPMVLFAGRLTEAKRPLLLFDAWTEALRLDERLSRCRLVFVGEGDLRRPLQRRISRAGLTNSVECLGGVPRPALIDLYRRALLTVHLAGAEPFGLVPVESMAAGTAVLAEPGGGVSETVLDGTTGWCRERLDKASLAGLLARIPASGEELAAMGALAAAHIREQFRYEDTKRALIECLENSANARAGAPEPAG